MNNKPLISGVMIFLNGEKFIEEAIASVLAQTYDNWELLLVDDGSTDNSTAIAQKIDSTTKSALAFFTQKSRNTWYLWSSD